MVALRWLPLNDYPQTVTLRWLPLNDYPQVVTLKLLLVKKVNS